MTSTCLEHLRPRLACELRQEDGALVLARDNLDFAATVHGLPVDDVTALLHGLDGTRTVGELTAQLPAALARRLPGMLRQLDRFALLDDAAPVASQHGLAVLLELEDLANQLLHASVYQSVFWRELQQAPETVPVNVLYGLAIENYHFLFREPYFDGPVLGYQTSTSVRQLLNTFYVSEYGHDELILRGLGAIGITREDLADTMPLTGTMGLCNALAYWADTDPLFFFATLGVLEGNTTDPEGDVTDTYIEACRRAGLDDAFIAPIRKHATINARGGHGNLTRCVFAAIEHLDAATVQRLRRRMHLFVEIYDAFYTGIWQHYGSTHTLLRRASTI